MHTVNKLPSSNQAQDNISVDVQIVTQADDIPAAEQFKNWVNGVLVHMNNSDEQVDALAVSDVELTIRVVGEKEIQTLNEQYRQKKSTTNVLSFPYEAMPGIETGLLGDIIICAQVVNREADEQGKQRQHHWAHMVTHGVLHLLGFDHIDEQEAEHMEMCEIAILHKLDIANPYQENNNRVVTK